MMTDLYHGPYPVDMTVGEAREEVRRMQQEATPYTPNPIAAETTRLFIQFSDDGQHIRKWQLEQFPRAFEFVHARLFENEKCRSALYKSDAEEAERVVSYLIANWLRETAPQYGHEALAQAIERKEWKP